MYNQLIFYCHFGAGDIFESREFVKAWMQLVPSERYCYAHGKDPRILLDIPNLEFKEITEHMNPMKGVWDDLNGNLYVNCWIGRDGRYVLPGIGCTVEKLYEMHNNLLDTLNLEQLPGEAVDYIPSINYSKYEVKGVAAFIYEKRGLDKIYIDNGNVQSNQAKNFDFNSIIERIAETYKDKIFICTQFYNTFKPNIYFLNKITGDIGFNLNEASFLSIGCSTLIGRNSGPHVFTQVKENVMNPNKKLLSFTYDYLGSSFVVNTDVKIRKYWSAHTQPDMVYREICETLND